MKVADFLWPSSALIDLEAPNKTELIRDLARRAASVLDVSADRIFTALQKREQLGSTGTGQGIALPHARFEELKHPFGLLARLNKPIAFDAIDEAPVDIIFLLLLPESPQGDQLNTLATVARKLRDATVVSDIRRSSTATDLYRTFLQ